MLNQEQITSIQNFLQNKVILGACQSGVWDMATSKAYTSYAMMRGVNANVAKQQPITMSQLPVEMQEAIAGVMTMSESQPAQAAASGSTILTKEQDDAASKALDEMAEAGKSEEPSPLSDEEVVAAVAAEATESSAFSESESVSPESSWNTESGSNE